MTTMTTAPPSITFIGYGEAGQAFACGLLSEHADLSITVYDVKQIEGITMAHSSQAACEAGEIIFCLVTADQAEQAASEAAHHDLSGKHFLDCNSCAPETKRRSALKIEAAGGTYIDVAVMTPVHPKLHKSPCLLAGPHAGEAHVHLTALGMDTKTAGPRVGDASTRKMIRSIMVKGLEALTLECFLAAKAAGIEDDILASLDTSYPGFGWPKRAPYMIERALTHGIRRAAEMREVVQSLHDLGIAPHVTTGTVARQQEAGDLDLDASTIGADNIAALTAAILGATAQKDET